MATSPLTSSQFVRLLDNRLRDVADAEMKYRDLNSMIPKFFNMMKSQGAWEEMFSVGRTPDIPEFNGRLTSLAIAPGYHVKIEHKEYGAEVLCERKLIDDKKYSVLENKARGLMNSAMRTKEKLGVREFAYANSTAFDFQTHEEGQSLASSSHKTKSGASTATGFDNSGTSALSKTSVQATRIAMKQFRDDIGERFEISDNLALVVPTNLIQTATEITQTQKGLYTGDHTMNIYYNAYDVIEYPRLDDYDTNNWFMVDMDAMKDSLYWFDRIMPEINNTVDYETFQMRTSVYFRCSRGWRDWRWLYMNVVS